MAEKNISQEFRLKNKEKTRNHFIEEKFRKELMSKKHKKVCMALNYIQQLLILIFSVTGCVSRSAFVFYLVFLRVLLKD